ncbi:MAG: hypothetical protein OEM19_05385 [Deltaproteobacteria bacterium]|nr:hypothetical protein [Deltaproteobacteria bacterium]
MNDYQYEISEEKDHYKVKTVLKPHSKSGRHQGALVEALYKHKLLRDDTEDFRFELERKDDGSLNVYAVFRVDKTELKYEFDDVKEDMDEITEKAQEKYWDSQDYAERFLAMLQVAKELDLI